MLLSVYNYIYMYPYHITCSDGHSHTATGAHTTQQQWCQGVLQSQCVCVTMFVQSVSVCTVCVRRVYMSHCVSRIYIYIIYNIYIIYMSHCVSRIYIYISYICHTVCPACFHHISLLQVSEKIKDLEADEGSSRQERAEP